MLSQNVECPVCSIFGDAGASKRDDRMFVVKVYYTNILSSRLAAPGSPRMRMLWTANIGYQAPDVQTLDSVIHRRNHYPANCLSSGYDGYAFWKPIALITGSHFIRYIALPSFWRTGARGKQILLLQYQWLCDAVSVIQLSLLMSGGQFCVNRLAKKEPVVPPFFLQFDPLLLLPRCTSASVPGSWRSFRWNSFLRRRKLFHRQFILPQRNSFALGTTELVFEGTRVWTHWLHYSQQ